MLTIIYHLLAWICPALNCRRGTASTVFSLLLAGLAVAALSGCCGPWWFCEDHHHHHDW